MKTLTNIKLADNVITSSFGQGFVAAQTEDEIESLDAAVEADVAALTAGTTCALVTSLNDADETILVLRINCAATGAFTDIPVSFDGASHAEMRDILADAGSELGEMRELLVRHAKIAAQCEEIDAAKRS